MAMCNAAQPQLNFLTTDRTRVFMKKLLVGMTLVSVLAGADQALAGNDQKRGQAGATELTVNPWARSSGWAGANTAGIRGVESMNSNIGGLAYVKGTEVLFSSTRWMSGTDVTINAMGIGQQLGKNGGVLGLSAVSWNLGDFYQTDANNPDQSLKFKTTILNIGASYSKMFSNAITGGITLRYLTNTVPDASASGVAFDGAVQYQTHLGGADPDRRNFKVGVALRNAGPELRFTGDGLGYRAAIQGFNSDVSRGVQGQSDTYEMPTALSIGAMYDFVLSEDHRISLAGNFTSNSFSNDQIQGGMEYAFMERFMVRGGYDYMKGNESSSTRTSAHTGLTAGATAEVPFGAEKNHAFAVDYSYRATNPWNGTHSVGIRLAL